jgi:hypothetical protein
MDTLTEVRSASTLELEQLIAQQPIADVMCGDMLQVDLPEYPFDLGSRPYEGDSWSWSATTEFVLN